MNAEEALYYLKQLGSEESYPVCNVLKNNDTFEREKVLIDRSIFDVYFNLLLKRKDDEVDAHNIWWAQVYLIKILYYAFCPHDSLPFRTPEEILAAKIIDADNERGFIKELNKKHNKK